MMSVRPGSHEQGSPEPRETPQDPFAHAEPQAAAFTTGPVLVAGLGLGYGPPVTTEKVRQCVGVERQNVLISLTETACNEPDERREAEGVGRRDDELSTMTKEDADLVKHETRVRQMFDEITQQDDVEIVTRNGALSEGFDITDEQVGNPLLGEGRHDLRFDVHSYDPLGCSHEGGVERIVEGGETVLALFTGGANEPQVKDGLTSQPLQYPVGAAHIVHRHHPTRNRAWSDRECGTGSRRAQRLSSA